jgi:hypothetical protein
MTTKAMETGIVLNVSGEILGPGSPYAERRVELRKEYAPVLMASQKIEKIDSPERKEQAVGYGRLLLVSSKELEIFYKGIKTQIDAVKKPVLADEHSDIDPLLTEKSRLEKLCVEYNQEEARKKAEADRIANEAALKQAQEDQLNLAIELDLAGEKEEAEQLLETPLYVPPVVTQAAPKVQGEVERFTYSMTVTDLRELLKAVLEGKAPMSCIVANESYLNGKARLEKDGFCVPGCRLEKKPKVSFRS